MRPSPLPTALAGLVVLAACDQVSQGLPFEPDPLVVSQRSIGAEGGLISHPLGLSIEFPRGALTRATKITVAVGLDLGTFPGSPEGKLIPGTFFNVFPAALPLAKPITIDVAVPRGALTEDDLIRLGIATDDAGGGITTEGLNFDLTSSILHGELPSLGAVAAAISANAVSIGMESPPDLAGGTFATPPSGAPPRTPSAADQASSAASAFTVRCSYQGNVRRCIDSGTIDIWASNEIQERLAADMVLLNPDVTGTLEFSDFVGGIPTRAKGNLSVTGTLRVRLGQAVTSFSVDDTFVTTGAGGVTGLTVEGSSMTFLGTSTGQRTIEYQVRPVGTGEQLVVRGEKSVTFDNEDGTTTTATLFIDMRLRR
jgi:hypothetical protein